MAVLLGVAFYSSWKVQSFAEVISADLDAAAEAIRNADYPAARQALADGAARCDQMRTSMNHLLRTADFTELEAALRAADGHLEMNAPEEAFGELRRAQVQVEMRVALQMGNAFTVVNGRTTDDAMYIIALLDQKL